MTAASFIYVLLILVHGLFINTKMDLYLYFFVRIVKFRQSWWTYVGNIFLSIKRCGYYCHALISHVVVAWDDVGTMDGYSFTVFVFAVA